MSKVNYEELRTLLDEANTLTSKAVLTKAEQARHSYLLTAISAVKGGCSLEKFEKDNHNKRSIANGLEPLPTVKESRRKQERRTAKWRNSILRAAGLEFRDDNAGLPNSGPYFGPSSNNQAGSFVAFGFNSEVKKAYRWYEPLFDPEVVTLLETDNGSPITQPVWDDTDNVATVVGEGQDLSGTGVNLGRPGAVLLNAYSYRTPLWRLSIEAAQDVSALDGFINQFQSFASDRISRGMGADIINGDGNRKPTGILRQLEALSVIPVVASGSSGNDGSAATGTNSIGVDDLVNLYFSVNQGYRIQPKCCWLMNDNTRVILSRLKDKSGRPLLDYCGITPMIFNRPVFTSPSMPNIGASQTPIIFGDMSYLVVRLNTVDNYIKVYKESNGLIEQGEVGLRYWNRMDAKIAYTGTALFSPLNYLINQS